jgi:hypothetical protein
MRFVTTCILSVDYSFSNICIESTISRYNVSLFSGRSLFLQSVKANHGLRKTGRNVAACSESGTKLLGHELLAIRLLIHSFCQRTDTGRVRMRLLPDAPGGGGHEANTGGSPNANSSTVIVFMSNIKTRVSSIPKWRSTYASPCLPKKFKEVQWRTFNRPSTTGC